MTKEKVRSYLVKKVVWNSEVWIVVFGKTTLSKTKKETPGVLRIVILTDVIRV